MPKNALCSPKGEKNVFSRSKLSIFSCFQANLKNRQKSNVLADFGNFSRFWKGV